ncbi:MAG: aminoglycoside 3'-phosphotransferase [Actinomycetota bacterium]|nr:aminoglycoside 3'-phosphotransferase [Actinomycetota bacterium]
MVALADGSPLTVVWQNELGGLTFTWTADGVRRFVKWAPPGAGTDLGGEASRLRWAAPFTSVPRVVGTGRDSAGSWLVTEGLPGENAVSPRWTANPEPAVVAIGHGLRRLHDRLPVEQCPYWWTASGRIEAALRRRDAVATFAGRHAEHAELTFDGAVALLARPPADDRLVVCHGDACAPNTVLDDAGHVTGHVDLGSLGVADRWADLAVATWSLAWNFGPGWDDTLLDAYGVAPDPLRTAYYRLLWDLG